MRPRKALSRTKLFIKNYFLFCSYFITSRITVRYFLHSLHFLVDYIGIRRPCLSPCVNCSVNFSSGFIVGKVYILFSKRIMRYHIFLTANGTNGIMEKSIKYQTTLCFLFLLSPFTETITLRGLTTPLFSSPPHFCVYCQASLSQT